MLYILYEERFFFWRKVNVLESSNTPFEMKLCFWLSFPIMIILFEAGNRESGGVSVLFFKLSLTYLQQGCM